MQPDAKVDFFISYTADDEAWATWLAWVLEDAGCHVILQAWDFRPGSNFVLEMDYASRTAERTILVLSSSFLNSEYTKPEWAAAFARDPSSKGRSVLPIRVDKCDVDGLLGQIVWIDLVGLTAEEARTRGGSWCAPGQS